MSSRSASALLDAALAVPFDPEEEDRRRLELSRQPLPGPEPVGPSVVDIAPEVQDIPPAPMQIAPDPIVAAADAAMLDANGEPPLPVADEDLPPVVPPSGAGGSGARRSAAALLADVADEPAAAAPAPVRSADQALPAQVRPRRSASVLLADVPEESSMLRRAADVPVFIMQGTTTGLKALADVFGADSPASQQFAERQAFWQSQLSPEAQASQQRVAQIQQAAQDQGLGAQVAAAGRAFAESPTAFVAQGLGTMAPTVATGGAARLFGGGAAAVQAAQLATGAAMGGGIVKGEIYQAVEQAMLQAGRSPQEAASAAAEAQAYGGENLDQILAGYGLGAFATAIGAERLAGRAIAGAAAPTGGVLRVAGRTALQEALPEAAQGSQEQLARNLAQQREGFEVPTMRGVAGAGALEGLAGLAIGGPAGVASSVGSRAGAAPTGVQAPWQAAREQAVPTVTRVEVVDEGTFGEPTTAAVERPVATGDERFAPPAEAAAPASAAEAATEAPAAAPEPATDSALVQNLPVVELPVQELQLSRDVPNFKEGADPDTGVVEGERLEGEFQRLGMAPIIVWERQDGRREIISGRHRWDLAKRTKQETIPSQVLREADGFTTQDALILDAELNIRDGQGSIKDYANYFRNTQIDRGAATQRGLLSRAKGRAGFEIGRSGSNDLYAAFANNAVSAEKAAAIASAAPNNDTLQRAALGRAGNMTAEQLGGFVRALSARVTAAPETQTDLFGADDSALVQAEQLSKAANAKARELQEQITAVRSAARRPEAARKMGVDVRDPEGVRRRITELEGQVRRYQEFYANPDVMAELQATMRVGEGPEALSLAAPDAQEYFNFADVPKNKQQAGQQAVDAAAGASEQTYTAPPVSPARRVAGTAGLEEARSRQAAAYRALLGGDAAAVAQAIRDGVPLSRLMLGYISREPATFNIRGAIVKSPKDLAMYNLAHRTPFFESMKIAVLDDRQQVIHSQVVSTGSLNESIAHPRDITAVALAARQANPKAKIIGFMIMHNHPSGDPTPSEADRVVTRRFREAGDLLGVPLLDHVITNGEQYFSFSEQGILGTSSPIKLARADAKPRLPVRPAPAGDIAPGQMAGFEAVPASEAAQFRLSNEQRVKLVHETLQTADPNMIHVINVDSRYGILSVVRHPLGVRPAEVLQASTPESTYAMFVSLPAMPPADARPLVRRIREAADLLNIHLLDAAMAGETNTFRGQGLLEEPDAPYGASPAEEIKQMLTAVHAEAVTQSKQFLNDVTDVARKAGGRPVKEYYAKAVKKLPAALSKVDRAPKVPSDLLRATIEAPAGGPSAARATATRIIEAMQAKGYSLYSPGGQPDVTDRHGSNAPYIDIALKFVKDGAALDPVVKEILVVQPAMYKAKKKIHDLYDRWRDASKRLAAETNNERAVILAKAQRKTYAQMMELGRKAYAKDFSTLSAQAFSAVQSSEDISSKSLGMSGASAAAANAASTTERALAFVSSLSIREQGNMPGRGGQADATLRVAEEAPRTKPRQFEAKARQNEALAPETRARLGSEYIPISLNAQAEAAKEWINTNGLEAAKLRIAQLSGNDTVPTPVDFAIGIEAAGRLSATGDHAGAAGIVSTMSQRATSLGQTISVLAMMARLTPEGIVLYGQNIVSRYINTLPQEAQDRIKALQAEVDRLRTALAEMKFKEGSEVIRSGKLGDEKIQDRIKRRVKARVQADLGPAAAGPEVTAETKARTQGLNRKVRDVLLSDGKQSEMVKQITQILTSEGNMPAAEAEAVGKSIVAAFTKIVTETRRKYVQGAKRNAGGRKGNFDKLLKMLAEQKDMTDAEFLGQVSRLMGVPGMTKEIARELTTLAQRYERTTDPDVRMVLGGLMIEQVHELVPADFWVKVRAFAYLSMLFAPKTWIRNILGNTIQWIADIGRDGFVTTVMDPMMSLLTGERTSVGLNLGARLKGLATPYYDVKRGYMWSKKENPSFNFRQNFAEGVRHLRMLAKLTTQNRFEISDVRSVGGRIFSSKFMRMWESGLAIALGAGDRAFYMSAFRASIAKMERASIKNGEWTGQPTPEMVEAAYAEAAYAIYQNPNVLSWGMKKVREVMNRITTFNKTDQYGVGSNVVAFTQVPGALTLRGIIDWSPLGFISALYRGMRGILYASSAGRIGAKFDQAAFNKEFTQALLGSGGFYAAGYYLYAIGVITASREDDDDFEAMRRASGHGAYRINLTALRRALLSGNWFTRQEGQFGDLIVPYDWAQPVAIVVAAGAEFAAQVERSDRKQLQKGLADKASMAAISLAAGAKSLEEQPLVSGLASFMKTWGYSSFVEAAAQSIAGMPSQFVPQLVRQAGQLNDNMVRETRGGDSAIQREFMKVLASIPGYSTKFPVRFDIMGQAMEKYQYGGNNVANVLLSPAMATRLKTDPVLQEVTRLINATGETEMVPKQVKRRARINGVDVDLTNEQLAAYSYYLGNFTMSHFAWRMAAPVYARLPDEMKVKMLAQDITDIDAAVKSAVLGHDPRRLTRNQMFLRQALVNSPLGQSVPPR